jgi:nucleoside-diphosphate-sugar epimerase
MRELAELVCDMAGHRPQYKFLEDKPAGVAYRVGDPTAFHRYYKPEISLEQGVARALDRG